MIYTVTLNPAVDRELVVPAIEFDSVLRAAEWRVDWGGKGFNVSRVLASLGAASVAVGFGGGHSGELLREGLNSLGIQTDFIDIQGETRTNVSIVSQSDNHYVKVNEPGPQTSENELAALLTRIEGLAQAEDWWVLAGSLPPGAPPSTYADLTRILERHGAHVILDTSGEALEQGCRAAPELVKPNAYEASLLTGLPVESLAQIAAAGQAIQQMGPTCLVISLGKDGALLLQPGQAWLAHSPQIEERNPIGAGDSMVGGLVWGFAQGLEACEALRWGIACGAATASLSGTAVGTRSLVESLLARTWVEPFTISV